MKEKFMKSQNVRFAISLIAAWAATLGIPIKTFAQVSPESTITPSEDVQTILKKACSVLASKPAFTVDVDINYDNVLDSGSKVQYSAFQKLIVNRPNQLKAEYTGDQRNTTFYYDGKTFTILDKKLNLYATSPAPATIDGAIAKIEEKYDITIPLSDLLVSDPCQKIIPNIKDSLYVGFDLVNRVPSYHFLFAGKENDFQLWISNTPEPVLQKVVITYRDLPSAPQYTAILSNWNFKPQIADNTFKFIPTVGAGKIEFLPSETPAKIK
jgi:hypothetical protein